ncbi:hypothetical protein CDLVIII_2733 [Clostridium sp. DL-VIII]|uniref:GNAT family N-acetyltransferase n=1 Tax=Clostridium sp. DL-VIII TaxID=641107 RepID=UPI00023AF946|nr:GNAT family N-acetyltransferase [Clostridium sp. DL-VIII]EHI99332.1 hypothetical protein CDLVIII_2733 [Clostridium sp. DL-VIII]
MVNKVLYRELCKFENSIPIFSLDWWMDAVCGEENWDVILVQKGGQIMAALPYYFIGTKNNIRILQPKLTQTNGIWIKYPKNQKYSTRLSYEKKIIEEIANKLEKLPIIRYEQNFKYTFTNWLSLYWRGFKQTTRYSYVIENLTDLDKIFKEFDSSKRQNIRKAEKLIKVKEDLNIEEVYRLSKMAFTKQGIQIPYSLEFLKRLDYACNVHKSRKIFYAEDFSGRIIAAIYIVWDEESAYYIAGGEDPEFKKSQAIVLLIWEAIKFSSKRTNKFDFEGSMIKPIERFFSSFGAEQKQYFNISKEYRKRSLLYFIAKDVYCHYSWMQKIYKGIRGG